MAAGRLSKVFEGPLSRKALIELEQSDRFHPGKNSKFNGTCQISSKI